MPSPPNEQRCPLCNGPNRCAMANGQTPRTCWCVNHTIPQDLLEQIPTHLRNKTCLCERCVERHAKVMAGTSNATGE